MRITSSNIYQPALAFAALILFQLSLGSSAYRHATLVEFLNYASYGLLAFVMLQAVRDTHSARMLAFCFSLFGLLVAIFALTQYFTANGKLYWMMDVPPDVLVFGPYVNHNHYAGQMEMLIPYPLVFATQSTVSGARRLFFGFAAIIMGVSVVESGSRGGCIALACQVVVLIAIGQFAKRKRGAPVALFALLAAMAILLAVLADSNVVARINSLREPGRADVAGWRMRLNRDSLAMVRAKPLLGWGFGTFPTVYPQFRSFYDDVPIDEAHDDYMQLLVEAGVVGGLIALWFLFVVFREGWRNLQKGQNTWDRGLTMAAMISVSGILVHSASDFNLHIPANAALFFVMCALAVAPVGRPEEHEPVESRRPGTTVRISPLQPLAEVEEIPQRRVVVRRI